MSLKSRLGLGPRLSISGRSSLIVLVAALAATLIVSIAVPRRAVAQAPAPSSPAIFFGPVGMVPQNNIGIYQLTVKAIYPSDPKPATPFKVEAATNYVSATLDVPPSSGDNIHEFAVTIEPDAHGKLRLVVQDLMTGLYAASGVIGTEADAMFVSTRIHPALRTNGTAAYPIAAVQSADGYGESWAADGTYEGYYSYTFEVMPAPKGGLGG